MNIDIKSLEFGDRIRCNINFNYNYSYFEMDKDYKIYKVDSKFIHITLIDENIVHNLPVNFIKYYFRAVDERNSSIRVFQNE